MDRRHKQTLAVLIIAILLLAAVWHLELVIGLVKKLLNIILPVLIGLLLAFILNVPVNGFTHLLERLFARSGRRPGRRTMQRVSLLLTLLCFALALVGFFTLVVPALGETITSIITLVQAHWPQWMDLLAQYDVDVSLLTDWLSQLDLPQLLTDTITGAGSVLGSIADITVTTVTGVINLGFSLVLAIYILLSKDTLARQSKKLLYAHCKAQTVEQILHIARLMQQTYARFLSGQCVEAVILGVLVTAAFAVFGLPYAGLVGVVTVFLAFIPYIGAFCTSVISALLALLVSPIKALWAIVVYQAVQFVENQFIYPHVVGNYVGLSPLWTLIAALIGGKLFGLAGMVLFIPLTAVIYTLLRERTNRKLAQKQITL